MCPSAVLSGCNEVKSGVESSRQAIVPRKECNSSVHGDGGLMVSSFGRIPFVQSQDCCLKGNTRANFGVFAGYRPA